MLTLIVILVGGVYIFLLYSKLITIDINSIKICKGFMLFSLFSPILELIYDLNYHVQNENGNNY